MRVEALDFVPKILHDGMLENETTLVFYIILTLLPGDDFVNIYHETTLAQQIQLGQDVAIFLGDLGEITGRNYDIGPYIPILPHFTGTWSAGHQRYWEILEQGSAALT